MPPAPPVTALTAAARRSSRVGFDTPLPDFTDCSFNSREPAADWMAVSHDGGPVRAFDARMPAFGEALTAAQIEMPSRTSSGSATIRRGRAAS